MYTITLRPEAAAFDAELELPPGVRRVETVTWVPGAYGFMRYGRDVVNVVALGKSSGRELSVRRAGLSGFAIEECDEPIVVRWSAMACEPAWGELAGYVSSEHAVLLATRYLFAADVGGPVDVRYVVSEERPDGARPWTMHHPSGAESLGNGTYRYPSFAALLDTPVVFGDFVLRTREFEGVTFHHVFLDRAVGGDEELERFIDDVMAIAEECQNVFGAFPFDAYTFVASFDPRAHWGLEHAHSTMIGIGPLALVDPETRLAALRVAAHELVHAWNVCRLKPAALAAPDFRNGSFPEELWIAEGFTRYYEFVLLARAGLLEPNRVIANLVNYWRALSAKPAYRRVSLVDSSCATFLNHHRYPGAANTMIDYYDGGMLAAFDLDVALRAEGPGKTTLDEAFSAFYAEYASNPAGYTHAEAKAFFDGLRPGVGGEIARDTEGKGELAVEASLRALGVELAFHDVPYLGIILKEDRVGDVLDDGPAAQVGIHPDDRLVSADGVAFSAKALGWLVAHRDTIDLVLRRGDRLVTLTVPVGRRKDVASATFVGGDAEKSRIRAWLGRELTPGPAGELPLTAYDNFHGTDPVT